MEVCKRFVKRLALAVLLLVVIVCGGCWDAKELARLAIVSAVGIDLDQKQPGQVLLTLQIIKPGEVKSASGGGDSGGGGTSKPSSGQNKAYLIISSSGKTVSEAFRNFASRMNREVYLSHSQFIVFGKEVAQRGLLPFVDYFNRTRQNRETVWLLIADGRASEIIETGNFGLEKIPANEITQLIINREMASQAGAAPQYEFLKRLLNKNIAAYTSFIQVQEFSGEKKMSLMGTAVFKRDKLVGEFDKTESRGFLWVINKVKRGNITVKSSKGEFSLGIFRVNSKLVPKVRQGKVKIQLIINVEYGITDETKQEDFAKPNLIKSLESLVGQAIHREINAALKKAFLWNADVFGFGAMIHQKFPKEWKLLKPVWNQKFVQTKLDIQINTRLRSTGLAVKPLEPK